MNRFRLFLAMMVLGVSGISASVAQAAPQSFDQGMRPVLENYLKIQDALAKDSLDGVAAAARKIETHARKLQSDLYKDLPRQLAESAHVMASAPDLEKAREIFKALSAPMVTWGKGAKPAGIFAATCDMAKAGWLQKGSSIRNPYYGKSMLTCGDIQK